MVAAAVAAGQAFGVSSRRAAQAARARSRDVLGAATCSNRDVLGAATPKAAPICNVRVTIKPRNLQATARFSSGCSLFKVTPNFVPTPGVLSTRTKPPMASTECFTIDRPRPVPPTSRERPRRPIEALEQARQSVLLDARAVVFHDQLDALPLEHRVQPDVGAAGPILDRVVDEVRQYVLERAAIASTREFLVPRAPRTCRVSRRAHQQAQHLIVDGVEIERLHVELQPTRLDAR